MSAAAAVRLGSAASAAAVARLVPAVLPVAVVLPVPVQVPHEPQLPLRALPVLALLLLALRGPPDPLLNPPCLRLPQVVVVSEVRVRLQGRRSFSAAMARSSPPTGKPT